jgi:hypothetical protein
MGSLCICVSVLVVELRYAANSISSASTVVGLLSSRSSLRALIVGP